MNCQRCNKERIMQVSGKTSDMCSIVFPDDTCRNGYVPEGLNLVARGQKGYGDYLILEICLDCGQLQHNWPVSQAKVEAAQEEEE